MTRTDQDRQKRQINRRIREVLAVRRLMRQIDPALEDSTPEAN
ncbi:hypothetical protein [Dactylosporangium salmoneum]|uniref:Uncharacterized protein n=1 Tax=Dactylosporangium salmoneum TaxID=53361 RepID=A0ABN3H2F0_9ACTN